MPQAAGARAVAAIATIRNETNEEKKRRRVDMAQFTCGSSFRRRARGPEGKAKAAPNAAVPSYSGLQSTLMAGENTAPAVACQGNPPPCEWASLVRVLTRKKRNPNH